MLELIDPISVIEKRVLRAIVDVLNGAFPQIVTLVEQDIQNNFGRIFVTEPEFDSLANGKLALMFGLSPAYATTALDTIINTLAGSVRVRFQKLTLSGNRINGGLRLEAVRDDFKDILGLSVAKVKTANGTDLPWLEWLLLEGDKIVIANYNVKYGNFPGSRSGGGIMVQNSSGFRVPPEFSGVADNNWITRAIDFSIKYLEALAAKSIERQLDKVL